MDHKNIFGKFKRFNADDKDGVCSGFVKWVNTDSELGLDSRKPVFGGFANNKVRKRAKIRNRYNQAPHLTQTSLRIRTV